MDFQKILEHIGVEPYKVVVVDPPWALDKIKRAVRPNQVGMDYPTMNLEEIRNLPVQLISADNSVCFLWTIQRYLPDSFSVLSAWGFKYQRTLTWDKGNGLCLFGFHHRTEFVVFGYKGKLEMYPRRVAIPTVFQEKTWRQHSVKPACLYHYAECFGGAED